LFAVGRGAKRDQSVIVAEPPGQGHKQGAYRKQKRIRARDRWWGGGVERPKNPPCEKTPGKMIWGQKEGANYVKTTEKLKKRGRGISANHKRDKNSRLSQWGG